MESGWTEPAESFPAISTGSKKRPNGVPCAQATPREECQSKTEILMFCKALHSDPAISGKPQPLTQLGALSSSGGHKLKGSSTAAM